MVEGRADDIAGNHRLFSRQRKLFNGSKRLFDSDGVGLRQAVIAKD
jgi:hypothetical protein